MKKKEIITLIVSSCVLFIISIALLVNSIVYDREVENMIISAIGSIISIIITPISNKVVKHVRHMRSFKKYNNLLPSEQLYGPFRDTYTIRKRATYATWNSIIDNSKLPKISNGDERAFVWIRQYGKGDYQYNLTIESNKQYEVMMFYHNNAADKYNTKDPKNAIMFRARIKVSLPKQVAAGDTAVIRCELLADNATTAWAQVHITATDSVALEYVTGSAKLFNNSDKMNKQSDKGRILPSSLFSDTGTLIGWHDLDGVLPGCLQYSGWIRYVFNATMDIPRSA